VQWVLKSPGLGPNDPRIAPVLQAAHAAGVSVAGELELFVQALAQLRAERDYAPQLLAVTGTNGKTTTTALTALLVERAGRSVVAAGKLITPARAAWALCVGADFVNTARGFMFALGCIQSLSCHTDRCPTGVTTQDPSRARALVVPLKTERVYMYHHATLHALSELLAAAGLDHPQQLRPIHFSKRTSSTEVMSFAKLYPSLRPGELIEGTQDPRFRDAWAMARADSFQPVG